MPCSCAQTDHTKNTHCSHNCWPRGPSLHRGPQNQGMRRRAKGLASNIRAQGQAAAGQTRHQAHSNAYTQSVSTGCGHCSCQSPPPERAAGPHTIANTNAHATNLRSYCNARHPAQTSHPSATCRATRSDLCPRSGSTSSRGAGRGRRWAGTVPLPHASHRRRRHGHCPCLQHHRTHTLHRNLCHRGLAPCHHGARPLKRGSTSHSHHPSQQRQRFTAAGPRCTCRNHSRRAITPVHSTNGAWGHRTGGGTAGNTTRQAQRQAAKVSPCSGTCRHDFIAPVDPPRRREEKSITL